MPAPDHVNARVAVRWLVPLASVLGLCLGAAPHEPTQVPGVALTIEADPSVTLTAAKLVDRCLCRDAHLIEAIQSYQPTKGPSRVTASALVPVSGEITVTPQRVVLKSPPRPGSRPFGLTHIGHDWSCTPELELQLHTAGFPRWPLVVTGPVPFGETTLRAVEQPIWGRPSVTIGHLAASPTEIQRFARGTLSEEEGQFWFTRSGARRERVLDPTPGFAALVGPVEGHFLPARDGVVVAWMRRPDGSRGVQMFYGPLPPGRPVENPEAVPIDPDAPVLQATFSEGGRETTWLLPYPSGASR